MSYQHLLLYSPGTGGTGWGSGTLLRIRRLGVGIPPSAQKCWSQACKSAFHVGRGEIWHKVAQRNQMPVGRRDPGRLWFTVLRADIGTDGEVRIAPLPRAGLGHRAGLSGILYDRPLAVACCPIWGFTVVVGCRSELGPWLTVTSAPR
jgi:hypothetical protein